MASVSAERFADLLLLRPPAEARAAALRLLHQGVSPRAIDLDVLAPALREVGHRWQQGQATVAQEHLATAVVGSVMAVIASRLQERPPLGRRIVLACTSDEMHELGLRMVSDFLEADGWEVLYVGASTPGPDLLLLVDRFQPDVVGLSTTRTTHLPVVQAIVSSLRQRANPPFVILGGAAYGGDATLARWLGGDAFAPDAGAASALLRAAFQPPPAR